MAQDEGARLGKGNLSLPDAVAQSVGYMGPVFSGTFFIPIIAGLSLTGRGAGIATPFAILLTAVGMLGLAWIISRYAKRIHAAGALYDYVSEGFGRPIGLLAGWVYYGGALMLTLAIGLAFGGFTSGVLETVHGVSIDWIWLTLAFWLVAWAISVLGVRISTRAQLFLALFSVAVVFCWAIYVILKGGSDGFSMRPFNPGESSFSGITYGIVYAGLIFVGFESAANLGEETAHPKRNIPRAIFYSVVAATIFYVVLAWALLLAFGLDLAALFKNFPPLYAATSNPDFGGTRFGEFVQWLVVIDIAAVGLGTATSTMRGIFALARDDHLPEAARGRASQVQDAVHRRLGGVDRGHHRRADRQLDGRAVAPGLEDRSVVVPVLPVRSDVRRVPALHRVPADRADGLQGAARREPRGPDRGGHRRRADERGGALRRRPQGAVPVLVRPHLVVLADLDRGRHHHRAGVEVTRDTGLARAGGARLAQGGLKGLTLDIPLTASGTSRVRPRTSPDVPQKRMAASAMRWAQATRSSIGTCSSTVCARCTSPGPKQTAGMPASTVSVAPSCQLSRPPSSAGWPRSRPAADERLHDRVVLGDLGRRHAADAPDDLRRVRARATGRAAAACAIQSLELALDERAVAGVVGAVGQVLDVALERAGGRVGDQPFAARDDRRHAVAGREVADAPAAAAQARAGARPRPGRSSSSRSR